jgi:hypothetical protein
MDVAIFVFHQRRDERHKLSAFHVSCVYYRSHVKGLPLNVH